MRILFIVLSLLFTAACDSSAEKASDIANELVYFKDYRTGLCFAYWSNSPSDRREGMLTNVPCDEKVERLMVNGLERAR